MPRARPQSRPDPASEAWGILVTLFKTARGKYLAEFELTPAQAHLLYSIAVDRPAQMGELAGVLGCDASNVTGIVDRLEARKLIARQPDPADRRVKLLALTAAGRRMRDRLQDRWMEAPPEIAKLSVGDKKALLEIARKAQG